MITEFKLFESKLDKEVLFINFNDVAYIKRWLDEGGDINAIEGGGTKCWTLLNLNANNSNFLIMKYLLEHGANPNIPNKNGNTPLLLSMNIDYIKLLMEYGADLTFKNNDGVMALEYILNNSSERDAIIEFLENDYPEEYENYKMKQNLKKYKI